jgi:hypothetical protein
MGSFLHFCPSANRVRLVIFFVSHAPLFSEGDLARGASHRGRGIDSFPSGENVNPRATLPHAGSKCGGYGFVIRSIPPMYGRITSGTVMLPSSF